MRNNSNNAKPVSRFIYTVEDGKSIIYTAHKDREEAKQAGEDMLDFAKYHGLPDPGLFLQEHTLN